ncbi:hypothetical protein SeGA_3770 [Salmonella enterica subsp. enterica serovar Gaminara str. A4-567]|nr:hypothetical protein SeGA_3770 [Salmonella enterica subsp. enterica serovar Gaminara str. A4-567]
MGYARRWREQNYPIRAAPLAGIFWRRVNGSVVLGLPVRD